jgi:hypothetical protein
MPLNSQQLRTLVCLVLIACCACSRLWTASAPDESDGGRHAEILASHCQHETAVLAKNGGDVFHLTRRELVSEWWLSVVCQNTDMVSAAGPAGLHFSSHPILCEFARREVAGVLLS